MTREFLHLPSAEGHGEYDLYVLAPEGMGAEAAKTRINMEIARANSENARNDMGFCDDGQMVEESIKAALAKEGFEFIKPTMTNCWDECPT